MTPLVLCNPIEVFINMPAKEVWVVPETVTPPITLSTGAIVEHTRARNGSQIALVAGRESGEMTESEWEEYCDIVRGRD